MLPKTEVPALFDEVVKQWHAGQITAVKAFGMLGMTKATFYRKVKECEGCKKIDLWQGDVQKFL